ncbi:quinone oxidoreductase [Leptospira sarikeiensis]|uniref:Quinone oxidoreductase n=2 Tax=Leptospira sarikeiensis TaxID=2484943 RepID=A0A4R9K7S0_9LEPT|nr:quinone oxidoreductase [Leptospira sarikeiensis]
MKAMIIQSFGGPEVFQMGELPKPSLKEGHVLVKVKATSVNPVDYKIRKFGPPISPELPAVLHGDVSGIIQEVPSTEKFWKVGDEVFGCAGGVAGSGGALAEYMLVDSKLIARKPKNISFEETAVLPLVSITAWEGLFDKGKLSAGNTILVTGGAGGVGHIAVQLARWAGARVISTATGESKKNLVLSLGAEAVADRGIDSIRETANRIFGTSEFDLGLDTAGGEGFQTVIQSVRIKGKAITINGSGSFDLSTAHSKSLDLSIVFMLLPLLKGVGREYHGKILTEISRLVEAGIIKPIVDPEIFDWTEIGKAHQKLEEGKAIGKIAVRVGN